MREGLLGSSVLNVSRPSLRADCLAAVFRRLLVAHTCSCVRMRMGTGGARARAYVLACQASARISKTA